MSMVHDDAVFFEDDKAFETWLVDNASTATHVWVRMAKKGSGVTSIDWTTAVDVALCFGWIDGISRRLNDEWYVQRFTPRRAKSVWSMINRERIERLTAEGRMRPAGLAEVEKAKADGRWDAAYDDPATAVVPDDLAAALAARDLTEVYAALDSRNRFASFRPRCARRPAPAASSSSPTPSPRARPPTRRRRRSPVPSASVSISLKNLGRNLMRTDRLPLSTTLTHCHDPTSAAAHTLFRHFGAKI
jgi:uncharacterized protein YdeI (YjbR/CyaY-like superfamily)